MEEQICLKDQKGKGKNRKNWVFFFETVPLANLGRIPPIRVPFGKDPNWDPCHLCHCTESQLGKMAKKREKKRTPFTPRWACGPRLPLCTTATSSRTPATKSVVDWKMRSQQIRKSWGNMEKSLMNGGFNGKTIHQYIICIYIYYKVIWFFVFPASHLSLSKANLWTWDQGFDGFHRLIDGWH